MAPAPRSRAIGLNFRPPVMDGGHVSVCVSCCSPPGAQRRLRRPRARGLRRRAPFRSRRGCFTARNTAGFPNVPGRSRGRRGLLTPSTPFAYPQVVSRRFAYFRVVRFDVSAGQRHFCSGFDSRQLHHERPWSGVVPKIIGRLTRHQTAVRVLITAGAGAAGRLVDGHEFLFGPSGRAVAELDLDLARIGKRGQIPLCGGPRYADLRG